MLQGSVLGLLLFTQYTVNIYNVFDNELIPFTDNTTLYAELMSPTDRINVLYSLIRDLLKLQAWFLTQESGN